MEHQPIQETPANEPSQSPLNLAPPPMNQAPTANAASGRVDESYFDLFPPGYWFRPHDDELIVHYLQKKVNQEPLPPNKIHEVKLYQYNPETLAERYKLRSREKEWYFFTPRDRKYRNGQRPNRAAGDGYWKATGADKAITFNGAKVGSKKALVFYKGKPPKGDKTQWIMHEFRVENPPKCQRFGDDDMKLDDWVLCKIYKKANKPTKNPPRDDQEVQSEQDDGEVAPAENPTLAPEESHVPNEPTEMDNGYNDIGEPMVFNPYNLITYNPHLQEGFAGNPQPVGLPFDHHHRQVMNDLYYGYANNPTQIQNAPLAQYPIRSLESNIRPTMSLNQYPPNFSYKPRGDEEELKFAVSKFDHCDFSFQSDYSFDQLVDGIGNGLPDDPVMMLPNPDVGNLEF